MIKKYAFYAVFSLLSVSAIAEQFSTPSDRVKDSVEKVITVLKEKSLDKEDRWKRIGVVINESFDFRSMSQSILATNWKQATVEERQQFVFFFSQYLEDTYRMKIEAYTNQKVEFVGETIRGKRAIVETLIITDDVEIPVNYKLKENDGNWFAYDVIIEGVSPVSYTHPTLPTKRGV